jgi:hypothetical protein
MILLPEATPFGNHWFAIGTQAGSRDPFTASFMPDKPNGSFQ